MNPELEKTPGLPIPQPATETSRPNFGQSQPGTSNPEFLPMGMEAQPAQPSAGAAHFQLGGIGADDHGSSMNHPGAMQPSGSTDMPANDDEEMDELWISKAKEIVNKTRTDPFLQSREFSKVKAEFLKNRYSKEIKVVED